jgi:hypothetical protein
LVTDFGKIGNLHPNASSTLYSSTTPTESSVYLGVQLYFEFIKVYTQYDGRLREFEFGLVALYEETKAGVSQAI